MLSQKVLSHIPFDFRSSPPEVFLGKGVLKICSRFTGEHPCRSVVSIKLLITLCHGCSPLDLPHIFRTPFHGNISSGLLFWRGPAPFTISPLKTSKYLCNYLNIPTVYLKCDSVFNTFAWSFVLKNLLWYQRYVSLHKS